MYLNGTAFLARYSNRAEIFGGKGPRLAGLARVAGLAPEGATPMPDVIEGGGRGPRMRAEDVALGGQDVAVRLAPCSCGGTGALLQLSGTQGAQDTPASMVLFEVGQSAFLQQFPCHLSQAKTSIMGGQADVPAEEQRAVEFPLSGGLANVFLSSIDSLLQQELAGLRDIEYPVLRLEGILVPGENSTSPASERRISFGTI
jgi:hypothetical protein